MQVLHGSLASHREHRLPLVRGAMGADPHPRAQLNAPIHGKCAAYDADVLLVGTEIGEISGFERIEY